MKLANFVKKKKKKKKKIRSSFEEVKKRESFFMRKDNFKTQFDVLLMYVVQESPKKFQIPQ
jgi:hypothetical protein